MYFTRIVNDYPKKLKKKLTINFRLGVRKETELMFDKGFYVGRIQELLNDKLSNLCENKYNRSMITSIEFMNDKIIIDSLLSESC